MFKCLYCAGGKAHSHYCHRAFCPICQRIQTAQNVKKFLPVMKYLASEGREFYFVTLTLQNCVTDDARYCEISCVDVTGCGLMV